MVSYFTRKFEENAIDAVEHLNKLRKEREEVMGRKSEKIFKQDNEHGQPLLKDVARQYIDELRMTHRRVTITKYEWQLRNYIIPEFGDKHVNEISTQDIISFVNRLLARNKALSPKTIHEIHAMMARIRRFSILHGYDIRYAADCIGIPTEEKKISILTAKEEEKLLTYLKENFNLTSMGILLSLFSGIRLGELCALKWNDFSLEERYFHVNRTMYRLPNTDKNASSKTVVAVEEFEKPSSIRTIPIPEKLVDYLSPEYVADAYILSGNKDRFIDPRTMENRFKAILKKCGIKYANFNTLRHTFATRCVELGFDVKTLSEILGHSSVNMILNRYVYPSMQTKHKNMNKLNELLV